MTDFGPARPKRPKRGIGAVPLLLLGLAALALPSIAEGHGRKAVPSDPALLEQYRAGLSAYLNRDYAAALKAWRPIGERESENSAAQLFLGFMHANGLGLAKDPAAAAAWYRRSADQDNMVAQIRLGILHRRGEGVAQDPVQAYLWASLAARRKGHVQKVAEALQQALATKMTAAQIAEADRLAGDWAEIHRKSE